MFRFVLVGVISCAMWLAAARRLCRANQPSMCAQHARIGATASHPHPGTRWSTAICISSTSSRRRSGMDALFAALDHAGVAEAVVLGCRWSKRGTRETRAAYVLPGQRFPDVLVQRHRLPGRASRPRPAEEQKRARLHPFICGFNSADRNAWITSSACWRSTPASGRASARYSCGMTTSRRLTYGEAPRANSQAFGRVLELAAKHDLPVLVHSNIGPSWRQRPDYLDEMESAIRQHPNTRMIWAHAGISRRIVIADHTDILRRLLQAIRQS